MDKWALAGSLLDLGGKIVSAAASAISAKTQADEDAAFARLFAAIAESSVHVGNVARYEEHSKAQAWKALRERFPEPSPQPTVLVDPATVPSGDDGH